MRTENLHRPAGVVAVNKVWTSLCHKIWKPSRQGSEKMLCHFGNDIVNDRNHFHFYTHDTIDKFLKGFWKISRNAFNIEERLPIPIGNIKLSGIAAVAIRKDLDLFCHKAWGLFGLSVGDLSKLLLVPLLSAALYFQTCRLQIASPLL